MSKELEALENIKHYDTRVGLHEDDYKIIETALKDYEHSQQQRELYFKQAKELKELYKEELKNTAYYNNLALKYKKALEIIKEKEVDIGWLKRAKDLHEYNSGMGINSYSALNQEEYELLKEILL